MKLQSAIAGLVVATTALGAQALSFTVTAGPVTSQAGAITDDFDGSTPAALTFSGGALYNASISGVTARPPGSTGNFWSIGVSPAAQAGPGLVTIAGGASYYGFLYGSPDGYNEVKVFDGANLLGDFSGSDLVPPANGDQSIGDFINFFAGAGETITSLQFLSTGNAFETDNHAFIAAVPEPQTYALMLAGLGAMGFMARRRRLQQ